MSRRDDRIDDLARALAEPMPRRRMVRVLFAGLLGLAISRPKRAAAGGKGCKGTCSKGEVCGSEVPSGGNLGCHQYCCLDENNPVCCIKSDNLGWCCGEGFECGEHGNDPCICKPPNLIQRDGARRVCRPCPPERTCPSGCCKPGEQCIHGECKPYCETETDRRATHAYDPATQCCTKDGIEQKYPIQHFERCRDTLVDRPGFKIKEKDLYCGPKGKRVADHYGKASFLDACKKHDRCYSVCKANKSACDNAFKTALEKACKDAYAKDAKLLAGCLDMATDYATGGSLGASLVGAFEDAQSEACQCCP